MAGGRWIGTEMLGGSCGWVFVMERCLLVLLLGRKGGPRARIFNL